MRIRFDLKRCLVFCWAILLPLMVNAAPMQWSIVPSESQLTFTGTQNGAPVTGEFKTFTGEIHVDPNDLSVGSIEIRVDIASLSTSYADLKETLLTSDWFNPKLFPQAIFKATQFKQTGKNAYEAAGTLTIRDKSAPVTLTFTSEEIAPNKRVVLGSTAIKRSTFGVGQGEWASTDEIKDEVTVKFKVLAVKK
ncbi:TPA: YceI family protein [Legionella pneumophila]|nr:YceI family protein [Legionella pneumophila]HAT8857937.1 polyisoprenoid-binding protein [Legionella pneumophila subsp. pneumophila]HAT8643103.1 polyisoprenoid-binding protein [Legionella pneumophila]HAT8868072.1 polyisoprenoid-binding protein [Legionella pneumophila subsp. pneumophila]HAT8889821.1 polyisoprenoid-binding protein [Legionella pneumophila subsp. pneumophila]HAT9921630.1 polyisoprenoid-binding protein [Legionella pneumophila subsp. pneumophila]